MRRVAVPILLAVLITGACDSSSSEPTEPPSTTTTSIVITTTTIDPEKDCRDLTADLVALFEDLLDELDGFDPVRFQDRSMWSRELLELEALGTQLDERAVELQCDPGAMQAAAFDAVAEREPGGVLTEWLFDLLLRGGPGDAATDQ